VSQCAKKQNARFSFGLNDPIIFTARNFVPSKAVSSACCSITTAPKRFSVADKKAAQALCATVLGTRGPKSTCCRIYKYADQPKKQVHLLFLHFFVYFVWSDYKPKIIKL
jgi:hypothetical protein